MSSGSRPRKGSWAALLAVLLISLWQQDPAPYAADLPSRAVSPPSLTGDSAQLPVFRVVLRQAISSATAAFVQEALAKAAGSGGKPMEAQALLIELDTPGGALDATRDLVQSILGSRIPIIVYVAPSGARAASAGTLITLAAHVAAMAPGTHIGAAHPVMLFGKTDDTMRDKVVNDTPSVAGLIDVCDRLQRLPAPV